MKNPLIKWSQKEYRDLPWRKNRSLYGTLVSEIMLQQTTVGTVLKHFDRFLKVFPDLDSLAQATEEEVCSQWQGLGYYRRARNLRKAAVAIVENFNGKFPNNRDELKSIPGIGDYTAGALLSIGMNKKALAIDANLERVLARFFGVKEDKGPKLQKALHNRFDLGEFDSLFESGKPREITEALMDVGRVYCQAKKADCFLCPLKTQCFVTKNKVDPLSLPSQASSTSKQQKNIELDLLRVVVKNRGKVIGQVKGEKEWLSGQIEIPTFILRSQDRSLKQYPRMSPKSHKLLMSYEDLPCVKTAITKYKIRNFILTLNNKEFQELTQALKGLPEYKYFKFDVQKNHFSTTTIKSFQKLGLEV
jgi:A/G-specific adenine glycosylase